MMTRAPHLLFGVGLVSLVTGCPLLEVAVEVPEVCLTYPDVAVEGLPGALSIERSFSFDDLDEVNDLIEEHADLHFTRGEVRAKSGLSGFSFVDAARVTVSSGDPASTLPPLTVLQCDGDCVPEDNRLTVPTDVQESAIAYVATDSLVVDLAITGRLPDHAWTMDVDLCMGGKLEYAFEP